jgi:hypothetical protein
VKTTLLLIFFVLAFAAMLVKDYLEQRRMRMQENRPVRAVATGPQEFWNGKRWVTADEDAHDCLLKDIEVAEPLSQEQMDELDDFMLFEEQAEDPAWVAAGLEWAELHATWKQKPDDELFAA